MQVEETTPSTPLRPTRASFVRGLPLEMPVEEVIERGREAGIELQPSDIHAARYYMRQVAAADGSSIPQQLLLGGTFVTKREPRGAAAKNGKLANGASEGAGKTNGIHGVSATSTDGEQMTLAPVGHKAPVLRDADDEYEDDAEPVAAPTRRGRIVQVVQANKAAKVGSKAEATRESKRSKRGASEASAATNASAAKAKARDEKATIGKALSDLDTALKPRGKRGVQTTEALEEQLRLIALRVGTQRVRELLDAMEELAKRA